MFEDNILIEIDGVASTWDTYCLGLNIVTPGSKVLNSFIYKYYWTHGDFIYSARDFSVQGYRKGHSRGLIWLWPYVSLFIQYSWLIIHFEASANQVSSTFEADKVKTEPDLVKTSVKFEEDDKDSMNSV